MQVTSLNLHDPHAYLGVHQEAGQYVLRQLRPGAIEVYCEVQDNIQPLKKQEEGIFSLDVNAPLSFQDYRIYHPNGLLAYDPYAFLPSIGDVDLYLFGKGTHYEIYNILGAHLIEHQGVVGVRFAVWVPSAVSCAVVADFNHWNGLLNPMRTLGASGIWEIFIPGIGIGQKYKFEIRTKAGKLLIKTDPYANQMEMRPSTASIVTDFNRHIWTDSEWMEKRDQDQYKWQHAPMNIYELHASSWRTPYGHIFNYRELAVEVAKYCREFGYTHVELLPLMEHPLDESWGYQVSGFYAPTSRFGSLEDFQWMVDHLHSKNIGVLLDWVPGHFPTDSFSLARFDGTCLYEHEDPRKGFHPDWGTFIFNYGRKETSNFLIANAFYWCDKLHIDGFRYDAVASMLYLDYGRKDGEWIPNQYGGRENLEAIEFLKHLNTEIKAKYPGVLLIAEESTAFPKVTYPASEGGLGFDMKWNMGWMNDTLRHFSRDPIHRRYHDNELTFGLLYMYSERYCLALSHDEVVHGKKSLLNKMPGDAWQKFANLRLLLSFQICQPGKKLIFMGAELATWDEWKCKGELEWKLLDYPQHSANRQMVKELNHFYLQSPALFERDFDFTGFSWLTFDDKDNGVLVYFRKTATQELLCIHHFTPSFSPHYFLHVPNIASANEVFNTDAMRFGGSNKVNEHIGISQEGLTFQLPPLATLIFDVKFK